jgi:restriction endonuclease Mrr
LATQSLDRITALSPAFFERLVVDLVVARHAIGHAVARRTTSNSTRYFPSTV